MYQPTLPAAPRPPALAPLSRTQTILLDGMFRGELDEVIPRLPAFDRVPFAAPGGIGNQFLDAIEAEPMGTTVQLEVLREGRRLSLPFLLGPAAQ